jgi:hypothetical protein
MIMKKKYEMDLLNSEEMHNMQGGYSCNKTGDTIICSKLVGNMKLCATVEATCSPQASFSSNCTTSGFKITCADFSAGGGSVSCPITYLPNVYCEAVLASS